MLPAPTARASNRERTSLFFRFGCAGSGRWALLCDWRLRLLPMSPPPAPRPVSRRNNARFTPSPVRKEVISEEKESPFLLQISPPQNRTTKERRYQKAIQRQVMMLILSLPVR